MNIPEPFSEDEQIIGTPAGEIEQRIRPLSPHEQSMVDHANKQAALKGMPEVEFVMIQVQRSGRSYGCRLSVRKDASPEVVMNTLLLCMRDLAGQGVLPPVETEDHELPMTVDVDKDEVVQVAEPPSVPLSHLRALVKENAGVPGHTRMFFR
jgi:hypothetical protein